ncbi:MAG: hypothetical protein ACC658_14485, partial [Acidimicrobiia bacterium]
WNPTGWTVVEDQGLGHRIRTTPAPMRADTSPCISSRSEAGTAKPYQVAVKQLLDQHRQRS